MPPGAAKGIVSRSPRNIAAGRPRRSGLVAHGFVGGLPGDLERTRNGARTVAGHRPYRLTTSTSRSSVVWFTQMMCPEVWDADFFSTLREGDGPASCSQRWSGLSELHRHLPAGSRTAHYRALARTG